ncbi:MAG: 2-oxo acid dehydrogenase subunit E2 [Armatimonadetes bacterium]|nr:2-oxo acid dehydrogenase subunit E2 [Armatimonadota bacterium]MDE2207263.1 2-oxo acid dehydrogenase subunit E2 [Armatimonadota bacterium]
MADILMPKMGDGMQEGTILKWLKHEGDSVTQGESIAEIETDKANVEIPAEETGVLGRIVVTVGQIAAVGATIAEFKTAGSSRKAAVPRKAAPADAAPEPAAQPIKARPADDEVAAARVKASPLARKIAEQLGIDLSGVAGTGPNGRIVERDLTALPVERHEHQAAASRREVATEEYVEVKPSRMREAIARRTVQSAQNAPHFFVTMAVDMDRALSMLVELNADTSTGKVTINDAIIKACAMALRAEPRINSTISEEGVVRQYHAAHIGMAVGIPDGLIIPVIRNCEAKTLRQISADAAELKKKALANQLKPEEYSGGTFSTSNLGMMGVDAFTAIINPPETAILAVGGVQRTAVETESGVAFRSIMKVTLSSDHRVLDGVVSARFLQEFKKVLESPYALLA